MEIRKANKDELEEIIKIETICFPPEEAASQEDMYKRFEIFHENFIVAINEGRVVGFINGCVTDKPELPDELYHDTSLHRPDGAYQTVFGLDVLPEYRRRGIAAQLLNYFIKTAKERGKEGMVLTCKDYLVEYYQKFGFEHRGVSDSSHGGSTWNDMLLKFEK